MIEAFDYVFPVFGGELDGNGHFDFKAIYGTAFYINNNNFLTCAHTIKNAKQHAVIALAYKKIENNEWSFRKILKEEIFDSTDTAIVVTEIERAKSFKWANEEIVLLSDVFTFGYPYGFDAKQSKILIRSYKGHIAMNGKYDSMPSKPNHYELSFMIPRGLSGGPLLIRAQDNENYLVAQLIGNEATDMVINTLKEVDQQNNQISFYEKTETLHRGIGIQSTSIVKIHSEILGSTIENYLIRQRLLYGQ